MCEHTLAFVKNDICLYLWIILKILLKLKIKKRGSGKLRVTNVRLILPLTKAFKTGPVFKADLFRHSTVKPASLSAVSNMCPACTLLPTCIQGTQRRAASFLC